MRLIQFIKWWWKDNEPGTRTAAIAVLWLVFFTIPASIFYGLIGVALSMFAGMISICVFWILALLGTYLYHSWRSFNYAVPPDDIQIINRLKGTHRQ